MVSGSFAIHHQYQGGKEGYDILLEWSLKDNKRTRENIEDGVYEHYYKNAKTVDTTRLKRRRSKNVNWKHVLGQDTKTYINEMINKNIERDIVTNRMIQLAKDRGVNMTTRSLRRRVNLLYRGVVRQNEQVKYQNITDPLGV